MLVILFLASGKSVAQRISFGLFADDDLILTPGAVDELNFNSKQTVIIPGNTVSIPNHQDEFAAVIAIDGRADLDVTVTIDAPATIDLDVDNKIPITIGFAYSNLGAGTNVTLAKTQAVAVPAGFNTATFPILRRLASTPGLPPTPDHNGHVQPTGKAYLFIYGTLGAVPGNAAAGLYTGDIAITVEYSTYN